MSAYLQRLKSRTPAKTIPLPDVLSDEFSLNTPDPPPTKPPKPRAPPESKQVLGVMGVLGVGVKASAKKITRPIVRFLVIDGGGTVIGQPGDDDAELLAGLLDRYGSRLTGAWHDGKQIHRIN